MATSANILPPLPGTNIRVVDEKAGTYEMMWRNYVVTVDRLLRTAQFGPLVAAANDAAAATAGVPIDGFYQDTTGYVKVRLT